MNKLSLFFWRQFYFSTFAASDLLEYSLDFFLWKLSP